MTHKEEHFYFLDGDDIPAQGRHQSDHSGEWEKVVVNPREIGLYEGTDTASPKTFGGNSTRHHDRRALIVHPKFPMGK